MNTLLLQLVNRPIYYKLAAYAWLGFTCYLLFKPNLGFENYLFFKGEDKAAHFVLFLNLTFLWAMNFRYGVMLHFKTVSWLVILTGVVFAISSEIIQGFLPKRSMDLNDIIFDVIGIALGYYLFFLVEKRINSHQEY